jgi:predicted Zn-dependent protease
MKPAASSIINASRRWVQYYNDAYAAYLQGDIATARQSLDHVLSSEQIILFPKLVVFATVLQLEIGFELNEIEYVKKILQQFTQKVQPWIECMNQATSKKYSLYDEEAANPSSQQLALSQEDQVSSEEMAWICDYYQTRCHAIEGDWKHALSKCAVLLFKKPHDMSARLLYAYLLLKNQDVNQAVSQLNAVENELLQQYRGYIHILTNNRACIQLTWNRPISARVLLMKCLSEFQVSEQKVSHLKLILHNLISSFALAGDFLLAKELEQGLLNDSKLSIQP